MVITSKKGLFFALSVIVLFISACIPSMACTIFMYGEEDIVLAGNNEDYYYCYSSTMWIAAPGEGTYGRVCFANSTYVQGGMNEKGLFYDGAMCPATRVPFDDNKESLGMDLGEIILSQCASVDEAVAFLENHNIPKNFGDHILLSDKSGNAAVVEWVDNEMKVVPKEGAYLIATNFFLSNTNLGGYPCYRYNTVKSMLESGENITVDGFAKILDSVSQGWSGGGTKYSNVCDLTNKRFYVYSMGDFSKYVEMDLLKELAGMDQGEKKNYDIDEFFSEAVAETDQIEEAAISPPPSGESNENTSDRPVMPVENQSEPGNDGKETANALDRLIIPIVAGASVLILLIILGIKLFHK